MLRRIPPLCLLTLLPCLAQDKGAFGFIPNNRTIEASIPFQPITAKQKMTIAWKDSYQWPAYVISAGNALIYQAQNRDPALGQGMSGYARRYGAAHGDQLAGTLMIEGILPSLTREDPRYFRVGSGAKMRRFGYAISRVLVTRSDSNRNTFNIAEVGGNAVATAIGNAWYPDTRTAGDNAQRFGLRLATDALSNVLKEFGPDVIRKLRRKK